jgi:hypothetical protein
LDAVDAEIGGHRAAFSEEELAQAQEAQKWASHIQRRNIAAHGTKAELVDPETGEIFALTDDQSARLRYIADTGQFPGPDCTPGQ